MSGTRHANLSRDMFNERKGYKFPIFQQGPNKPPVDADFNDGLKSFYTQLRRIMRFSGRFGGMPTGAWLMVESVISNIQNFAIQGGDGTLEGAGRVFLEGHLAILTNTSIEWDTTTLAEAELIHAKSDALTSTQLTWGGANWTVNEHVGRTIIPNVVNGTSFVITSNTQNTITISAGDMSLVASAKDHFRIDLQTPGGSPRTDFVYLDFYLDETDEVDDPNLLHPLDGGSSFVSAYRNKLRTIFQVRENVAGPSANYVDPDGNTHYYAQLGRFFRLAADPTIITAGIVNDLSTDLMDLDDIRQEIIWARGNKTTMANRLAVVMDGDGILQADIVFDVNVDATADIDQTKIDDTDVVDDSYVGTPSDLADDLNQIRTIIKEAKGTVAWDGVVTQTLEALNTEVTTARGNLGSLDARLDVSIDDDGYIKTKPLGKSIPRLFDYAGIVFTPKDTAWATQYRLHQARGFFHSEFPNSVSQLFGPYIPYDLDHTGYPLDVTFGAAVGPGGPDNSNPGFALSWYNVYLIGKDDGSLALVYSDVTRAPFNKGGGVAAGPKLDAVTYDFPGNGWKYWAFIGALRNEQAGSWQIVPCRKYGRHTQFEQAQQVLAASVNQVFTQLGIGNRIPETSMRANLLLVAITASDGSVDLKVRAASVVSGTEKMLLQDLAPLSPLSQDYKLRSRANSNATGSNEQTDTTGWTATDNFQRIDYQALVGGAGTHNYEILVLGYEEFPNFGSGEPTWP